MGGIPEHLNGQRSPRGFMHMPVLSGTYGGHVKAYESSAAAGPHMWLQVEVPADLDIPDGPTVQATIHLNAQSAWMLADQIRHLIINHYQGDASPLW